ncbi:putative nuclease HARBI1 [Centroberyx gerrardi]|uniref:putative nuclease HARBI1 n=1 Tax=Centroberyx gerrardi TaxID=166262 RepID=UPI003AAD0F9E
MAFAPPVWFAVLDELVGNGGADGSSPRSCFDDFDDEALFKTFHLTRPCISFIADNIELRMRKHAKKTCLSVDAMVMIALNYYAQGASSVAVQERLGVNYSDCPEVICTISKVVASMADQFISFPGTRCARANVACKTEKLCGIQRVLGVVAAAHFKIRASPYEKDTFRSFLNTLGYTSVMTQIICDSDGNILSAEMCCVGSTPEQEMWESSFKGREMEGEVHGRYWVVGGRGYHLSEHVLTAVSQPANEKEVSFNEAHAKIHTVMRTTLGSIKRRFKCLMQLGFAQETSLEKKADIIKACCVLHNIAKKFSVPAPPVAGKIEPLHPSKRHQMPVVEIKPDALRAREELINRFSAASSSQNPVIASNTVEDV